MSKSVYIHVCDRRAPEQVFHSPICFDLGHAANQLERITAQALSIQMPVSACWMGAKHDIHWPAGSHHASVIDSGCTWLVYAGAVKPLVLYREGDSEHSLTVVKAAMAYLRALPDDWPLIVHWV